MIKLFCTVLYLNISRFNTGLSHKQHGSRQRVKLLWFEFNFMQALNSETDTEGDF